MLLEYDARVNKNEVLGVRQRRQAAAAAAPAAAETVSGPAAQSLPSTRAGGQDDVSSQSNKSNVHPILFLVFILFLFAKGQISLVPPVVLVSGHTAPIVAYRAV